MHRKVIPKLEITICDTKLLWHMEIQLIQSKIHTLRGERVMLDFDLAELYEVLTKALNQAVKRNIERFPEDFMFQLDLEEWQSLRSQIVASNARWSQSVTTSKKYRADAYAPFAFTEQGVAMLSGVLRSPKAVQVNVAIMRAFVMLRRYTLTYAELAQKIAEMEARMGKELADIREVLRWMGDENHARIGEINALDTALDALFDRIPEDPPPANEPRTLIGFKRD